MRTGAEVVLNPDEGERLGLRDGAPRPPALAPRRVHARRCAFAADHPAGAAFVAAGVPGAGVERLLPPDRGPVRVEIGAA